jgi:tRNA1(Val) A37 N6-methylase TrmN6
MNELKLLGERLRWLTQAPRPSEDAFWLAATVPPLAPNTVVLDAACGNGAVGLALAVCQLNLVIHGLELNPTRVAEAHQHALLNGVTADFRQANFLTTPAPQRYRVILCNPPFHLHTRGYHSPDPDKSLAHGLTNLGPWLTALLGHLDPEGAIYLILHSALEAQFHTLTQAHGGVLQTRLLASHPTRAPKRLLARWAPQIGQSFQAHALPPIPTYHTQLREAVLRQGQNLATHGYGW